MDSREFDELLDAAKQVSRILRTVFADITGEDISLDSALRNYPLVTLGAAAGLGAVAGWWVGHKRRPALPPPPRPASHPLDYLEQMLPEGMSKLLRSMPDAVTEEAGAAAKNWVDSVLEPMVKQRLDNVAESVATSKWGSLLRQAMERMDPGGDIQLDDPQQQ
ncbi:MAG TPA: hypothetical protein VKX16_13920 [Chloroflexota bacterium]|nr:hypothetical protein [Chloroflexota bacterium]